MDQNGDLGARPITDNKSCGAHSVDGERPGHTNNFDGAGSKRNKSILTAAEALPCTGINVKNHGKINRLIGQARNG